MFCIAVNFFFILRRRKQRRKEELPNLIIHLSSYTGKFLGFTALCFLCFATTLQEGFLLKSFAYSFQNIQRRKKYKLHCQRAGPALLLRSGWQQPNNHEYSNLSSEKTRTLPYSGSLLGPWGNSTEYKWFLKSGAIFRHPNHFAAVLIIMP